MKEIENPPNLTEPNGAAGYAALKKDAALVDFPDRRVLRLSGRDPVGMLNAVLTGGAYDEEDLREAGAVAVYEDCAALLETDFLE